jgi:putative oxidoreductase
LPRVVDPSGSSDAGTEGLAPLPEAVAALNLFPMTTHIAGAQFGRRASDKVASRHEPGIIAYVALLGRILYSGIFIATVFSHFTERAIRYAASMGVPLADVLVPLSGIIATVGGVGILIGYRAKVGAWLVVLFLVPVTLIMHRFWGLSDPLLAEMQQINFMKNLALLGGALLIAYFGSGPLSLDKVTKA